MFVGFKSTIQNLGSTKYIILNMSCFENLLLIMDLFEILNLSLTLLSFQQDFFYSSYGESRKLQNLPKVSIGVIGNMGNGIANWSHALLNISGDGKPHIE